MNQPFFGRPTDSQSGRYLSRTQIICSLFLPFLNEDVQLMGAVTFQVFSHGSHTIGSKFLCLRCSLFFLGVCVRTARFTFLYHFTSGWPWRCHHSLFPPLHPPTMLSRFRRLFAQCVFGDETQFPMILLFLQMSFASSMLHPPLSPPSQLEGQLVCDKSGEVLSQLNAVASFSFNCGVNRDKHCPSLICHGACFFRSYVTLRYFYVSAGD